MTAQLLTGAPVATSLSQELTVRIERLASAGITPQLAIVSVGERSDDQAYERSARRRLEGLGISCKSVHLPLSSNDADLSREVRAIKDDPSVHGLMVLRPLPAHLNEDRLGQELWPAQDVDGMTPASLAAVLRADPSGFAPCTAAAVMEILNYYKISLSGAEVVVVGRSLVIGRPVALLLLAADATVTICHSKTADLDAVCKRADIVIAAVGKAGCIGRKAMRAGQVLIDVGMNWNPETHSFVGDIDFEAASSIVRAVTPVPKGVGSVTTAVLAKHVVEAAERRAAAVHAAEHSAARS
ncbi:bifunctional 5,10-methylene-tetrahydrofolate dehydrogenase/5,10-methylene-tetrahydrofolate cyclohydrolase [Collinsella sp. AGMB00827]|uniref:Bifunctional protein FolD n=1 Tax=Collinsella ureilytica TaxID=2869515 RepID=A0ABS7MKP5_9ACTN|nr:tetrahydrofolate dehydrogenase/cyclohydrolase catalytic domain-containing protein [Collinsella urealyticum]MBY4797934.1 bifunctional 5,10-methylene-tetrahydrofolate dehydrogenase/5,10-methylene-tetrahydrofolate cyclohydrolase [Collinsella urealyticum]